MPISAETITFEHKGIGSVISQNRLAVPLNQREYAWEAEHVSDLFTDFAQAISKNKGGYFLGTIVLTRSQAGHPEVSDGQQRLATTTILLAAIRDYCCEIGDEKRALSIEQDFLFKTDFESEQTIPNLRLNVDDNQFFIDHVLKRQDEPERCSAVARGDSHTRISGAAMLAAKHVQEILAPHKETARPSVLAQWLEFIRNGAQVIMLTVPDHLNAFVMFETLNDRGLRASQADLLKNYLLSLAGDRLKEAQQKWAQMLGVLESIDEDDISVTFLRHLIISTQGPTREREVYEKVRSTISSEHRAIEFLDMLVDGAHTYTALLNPNHRHWNDFGTTTRRHVETLLTLQVEQIRPLLFSVAGKFDPEEIKKSFRLFVSWVVRFMIVGGGRGGVLDRAYSLRAQEVGTGRITTANELVERMSDTVPSDSVFEAAFSEARVSKVRLARYYLRSMEQMVRKEAHPELEPIADETIVNLEHILPANPEENWQHIEPEVAKAHYKRIGNMVLMNAKQNSTVGNSGYAEKRSIYADSTLVLTKDVANYDNWGVQEIGDRQRALARIAVETWPVTTPK